MMWLFILGGIAAVIDIAVLCSEQREPGKQPNLGHRFVLIVLVAAALIGFVFMACGK